MKNLSKFSLGTCLLFTLFIGSFISCKKDVDPQKFTDAQKIEKAKSWYENEQKGKLKTISGSNGKEANLIFTPDWEKASVEWINGTTVITTRVKTNLSILFGRDTEFNLIIREENNNYVCKTISTRSSNDNHLDIHDLYKVAFSGVGLPKENSFKGELKILMQILKVMKPFCTLLMKKV